MCVGACTCTCYFSSLSFVCLVNCNFWFFWLNIWLFLKSKYHFLFHPLSSIPIFSGILAHFAFYSTKWLMRAFFFFSHFFFMPQFITIKQFFWLLIFFLQFFSHPPILPTAHPPVPHTNIKLNIKNKRITWLFFICGNFMKITRNDSRNERTSQNFECDALQMG